MGLTEPGWLLTPKQVHPMLLFSSLHLQHTSCPGALLVKTPSGL